MFKAAYQHWKAVIWPAITGIAGFFALWFTLHKIEDFSTNLVKEIVIEVVEDENKSIVDKLDSYEKIQRKQGQILNDLYSRDS